MASMFESDPHGDRADSAAATNRDPSPLLLARLIEGEIIPRLLLAHRADAVAVIVLPQGASISTDEAADFVPQVLALEVPALLARIEAIMARGIAVESVYIDLLAPVARGLGEWWERDACDFVDVTMGLWRLQQIVHELAARMPVPLAVNGGDRRAFFTVAPGNQHSFGLVLIEEFFRRAGWQTWSAAAPSQSELIDMVSRQWFELVGFTVTCDDQLEQLPVTIAAVRLASRNPALAVMVGGPIFNERPELAHLVGADATAADGKLAVKKAEMLLELHGSRPSAAAPGFG